MPLEYRDVLDMYDELHDAGVAPESLPEWSTKMNQLTSSEMYSAGLHDNWIKRASVGIDRLLEKTGAPQATEALGRQIGGAFGQEEAGAAAGKGIPRMLVNLAPLLIPGGGVPLAAARFGLTGALAGAETYTATDSPLAGLVSGVTFAGIPGITGAAEQLTLRALGKPLLQGPITNLAGEEIGRVAARRFAETTTEKLLEKAGGQIGAFGTLAASQPLQQRVAGQEVTSPLAPENLVSAGISLLPFAALHLGTSAFGRTLGTYRPEPRQSDIQNMLDLSQKRVELRDELKRQQQQSSVEQMPDADAVLPAVEPKVLEETQRILSQIRGQQIKVGRDESLSPEDKLNQINLLSTQESELARTNQPTPDSVFGNKILPDEPRQEVLGRQLKGNDSGTWRAILVSDDPMNPEELRGRVIGYSTKGEPPPVSGVQTQEVGVQRYSLPDPQWWSVNKSAQEWSARRPPRERGFGAPQPGQVPTGALLEAFPRYPEMTQAELSDSMNELKLASDQAKAAQTSGDLQSAVVRLHGVQGENDMTMTNDVKLKPTTERLINAGVDDGEAPKLAVAVEAKKTENKLKAATLREEERAVPPLTQEEAAHVAQLMGEEGYSVITADKLSHGESTDVSEQSLSDISSEAAFNAVRSPTVRTAYDSWPGRERESTFGADAQVFVDLTEKYGSIKGLDPEAAAEYLNDSYGTSKWDAQELGSFLSRPHVQEMSNAHDRTLTDMQRTNEAPTIATPYDFPTHTEYPVQGEVRSGERVDIQEVKPEDLSETTGPVLVDTEGRTWTRPGAVAHFDVVEGAPEDLQFVKAGWVKDGQFTEGSDYFPNNGVYPTTEAPVSGQGRTSAATVARVDAPVWLPEEAQDVATIQKMGIDRGGHGMVQFLANSGHPFFGPLGQDLLKFGDSLSRITGSMRDIDGGALVKILPGYKYEVRMSPAVLRSNDAHQMYVTAHELVHGLSLSELQNPTNETIRTGLDQFREGLIDKLPTKLKNAVNNAIESDWYNKWSRREVTFESLVPGGGFTERNLAYAMLNVDELLSQGLTNHDTRRFMQSIKSPEGTWYSRFTNFVRQLLGVGERVPGTAFEEFLSRTDQLLDRGEYVSSFRNFANRYYENLGLSDSFVRSYTQRAMSTILDKSYTADELLSKLRFGAGGVRSPAWSAARRDTTRMFQERGDDMMVTHNALSEFGHEASHSGLDDYAEAMVLGEIPHDALDILPAVAARYVTETAKDFRDVLGAVHAATLDTNKGALNLADPATIQGPVKELLSMLDRVSAQARAQEVAQRSVESTVAIAPDGYYDRIVSSPEAAPSWATGEPKTDWYEKVARFAEPITQWARRVPAIAEATSKGRQLLANSRKMADAARLAFGTDLSTGQLDHKTVKATERILGNVKLEKAADKWIYATQTEGEKAGKILPLDRTHPEVQKALTGLSSKEQDQVETIMQQRLISTQAMQAETLEKMLQIGATRGAAFALADGKKVAHATELSEGLLRAATADRNDPEAARQADIVINNTQRELSPDAFLKLLNFTANAAEKWKATQELFTNNPDYANGQRYGKYLLTFKDGKETVLAGVNSKKEAESIAKGKPYKLVPNRAESDDAAPMFGPGAVKTVNRLRELEQREINMLRPILTPDQLEAVRRASAVEQYATEQTYAKGVPGLQPQPRGLTKGADRLPWLQNHFSWISKTSSYWSRQLLRAQGELALLDPEIASNPELRSRLEKHFDNMLQSDPVLGRFLQRFTTTWFLGWNPASAIINGTQPFVTHVAELTSMTGKPFKSYKTVMGAFADVIQHGATGKWRDPDIEYALNRASKEGELDLSMHDDRAAAQETLATNQKRVMERNRIQTTGQRLSTLAGNYSTAGLWMFRTVERINNMLGFIEGVKHYREFEPNLSRDELYAKAREYNASVNYGGGVAARPVGLYGTRGAFPRTASMLAGSMQNYVLGSTFQLARYIKSGYFRPEGLTPSEIHSARTAAVQMLATQLAAAGVLGLPFVSSGLAVLDKAFPDLETNRHLREWMNKLLGEDGENGHLLTDIAMTGIPSMTGWDLQSRLTMGNTVPGVSEINGFQPELLLGAPVNLISNFVKGGLKLAAGDVEGVTTMMPSGLKKITQLLVEGGQVKDYRDRPIFTPTPTETAGLALGFQPKRLSDYNAAQRIAQLAQDNITRREGQFHQQMGEEVLKGNFGSVRQNLQQRLREDKTFDAPESVRAIARAAEELTFPRDLRREGTSRSSEVRGRLLATFGLPLNETSETGRLQFRHQVESRLGLPTTSSTDLRQAQLMDRLKQANPNASRSELRRQVSLLSSERRPRMLALPTE